MVSKLFIVKKSIYEECWNVVFDNIWDIDYRYLVYYVKIWYFDF